MRNLLTIAVLAAIAGTARGQGEYLEDWARATTPFVYRSYSSCSPRRVYINPQPRITPAEVEYWSLPPVERYSRDRYQAGRQQFSNQFARQQANMQHLVDFKANHRARKLAYIHAQQAARREQ